MKNETVKIQIELDADLAEAIRRDECISFKYDVPYVIDAIKWALRPRPKRHDVVRVIAEEFDKHSLKGVVLADDRSAVFPILVQFDEPLPSGITALWFTVDQLEVLQ